MMENLSAIGKLLILVGIILALAGAVLVFQKQVPFIGRLPGDIFVQKKNFSFYFPITTSILLSIIISLLFYFFNKK